MLDKEESIFGKSKLTSQRNGIGRIKSPLWPALLIIGPITFADHLT